MKNNIHTWKLAEQNQSCFSLVSINDLSESFSNVTRSTKEKFGKVESLRL